MRGLQGKGASYGMEGDPMMKRDGAAAVPKAPRGTQAPSAWWAGRSRRHRHCCIPQTARPTGMPHQAHVAVMTQMQTAHATTTAQAQAQTAHAVQSYGDGRVKSARQVPSHPMGHHQTHHMMTATVPMPGPPSSVLISLTPADCCSGDGSIRGERNSRWDTNTSCIPQFPALPAAIQTAAGYPYNKRRGAACAAQGNSAAAPVASDTKGPPVPHAAPGCTDDSCTANACPSGTCAADARTAGTSPPSHRHTRSRRRHSTCRHHDSD